ncbi:hypothetical protein IQ260_06155 [Leptolyngbya cf. ectocarpi LEGE 11479]|uniref:VWFA domain-containing protein n=1 Tax=Leptolyngbya cf. ectocarpi LEGE 11479 TaxID=1828722 RepID=A0A928X1S7_LEPEC|nr:hypothetical protein [Leptolyngbya ectocarpi]MBE9066231.1 hypothetical protein [Leptolyngbya cf. ectocarpi LEGE 11479]
MADIMTALPAQLHNRSYTLIYAPTQLQRVGMTPGFDQRWQQFHPRVLEIAGQCHALADNGLTVYCQADGDDFQAHYNVNGANLESLMASAPMPERLTLAPVLAGVFDQYFAAKATGQQPANGEIILILIDGEPTDRLAIAKQIVAASQKLDHHDELGIGWIQVGDDYITKGFLVTLDDNLREQGAKFDIVDHKLIQQIACDDLANFLMDVLTD